MGGAWKNRRAVTVGETGYRSSFGIRPIWFDGRTTDRAALDIPRVSWKRVARVHLQIK